MAPGEDTVQLQQEVVAVWADLIARTPEPIRRELAEQVGRDAARCATRFYAFMLERRSAHAFLSNELVNKRLHTEMERWLRALFRPVGGHELELQVAHHIAVGAVHARIKLPIELLTIAFHLLGRELAETIRAGFSDEAQRLVALHYAMALLALASGLILSAFSREIQRGARNDEAYRLAAFKHDALLERERQRAALSEWVQRCLIALPVPARRATVQPLRKSEFAQWVSHKGRVLFEGLDEIEAVFDTIDYIDSALLPRLCSAELDPELNISLIEEFDSKVEYLRYVMGDLFERVAALDTGRDSVTRLLNRRYLATILAREIDTHREAQHEFSVILVRTLSMAPRALGSDSEEVRNSMLQRIAMTLIDHAGAGDHLFRYTDQDFLIVEVERNGSRERAELLHRKLVTMLKRDFPQHEVQVRIAVAPFDGHPDYQRMIRRAEFSLAAATPESPVVLASPPG